jgi:hypothetical protein
MYAAVAEAQPGTEGQRECSRGQWCASRTVIVENGERTVLPALGQRAFCGHDWELIGTCIGDLPAIYLRLQRELAHPVTAETRVHMPFGPSIAMRLDVDAAQRLTATALAMWAARVRAAASLKRRDPRASVHTPRAVALAARTLARNPTTLFGLQSAWAVRNAPLPPGRGAGTASRGQQARCQYCGRRITRSAASGTWWAADSATTAGGSTTTAAGPQCKHAPAEETVTQAPGPVPADLAEELADAEIVRVGPDFIAAMAELDGAAAGLAILHLHYWDRAVLLETPARPEELLGVDCRACSLRALRRAEPAWYSGDPDYYSECAECGDLMTENDYRLWVGQLHAYQRARLAAMPVLATTPVP